MIASVMTEAGQACLALFPDIALQGADLDAVADKIRGAVAVGHDIGRDLGHGGEGAQTAAVAAVAQVG